MRRTLLILVAAAGMAWGAGRAQARPAHAADASPVVVELFTAQGCGACAKADAVLQDVAGRRGVVALTFPVDYWDYLGWRDTFAQPGFTDRQRAYADRLKIKEIYTPEIVVDGRREASALDRDKVAALMTRAAGERRDGPSVRFLRHGARVEVGDDPGAPRGGEVWLVRYDPSAREVKVRSGENKGKTIAVHDVVRDLVRLGGWSGRARTYATPKPDDPDLKTVVLVQGAKGGRILAAAKG